MRINMRKNLILVSFTLFIASCAAPNRNSNPQVVQSPADKNDASLNEIIALSKLCTEWKTDFEILSSQENKVGNDNEILKAYLLGAEIHHYLNPTKIEIVLWLLEELKKIENCSYENPEMSKLARNYNLKENDL